MPSRESKPLLLGQAHLLGYCSWEESWTRSPPHRYQLGRGKLLGNLRLSSTLPKSNGIAGWGEAERLGEMRKREGTAFTVDLKINTVMMLPY